MSAQVLVEIVADIVCPWCFIGKRRLEQAVALVRRRHPGFLYATRWRPFFLNPDTPPEGEPYRPFLEQKFGGPQQVETLFARVREAGQADGIDFAFEKIRLRANTLPAHRLLYWAQQRGSADALVERLFVAQFQRGEHVGDLATLAAIAAECGYDAAAVGNYLRSNADVDRVCGEERRMRAAGISAVPTFIINGREIIVGAQDPALLADAMVRQL